MSHLRRRRIIKPTAVVDLDGVIADYFPVFEQKFNKEFNTDISKIETDKHDIFELLRTKYGVGPFNAFLQEFEREGNLRTLDVLPYAKEFLGQLDQSGHRILALTARPESTEQDTQYWLENNELPYHELAFRRHKADHLRYRMAMGWPNIKFMIEDNATTANKVAEIGINSYLLNMPYNQEQTHESVIRVNSLQEVLNHEIK